MPVVGTTVLKPGQKTTLRYPFMMHPGMEGAHHFEIVLRTNSPATPEVTLTLRGVAG